MRFDFDSVIIPFYTRYLIHFGLDSHVKGQKRSFRNKYIIILKNISNLYQMNQINWIRFLYLLRISKSLVKITT